MALRVEKAVSPTTGAITLVLVDEDTFVVNSAARDYAMNLRAAGRSPNTAKAYLPRICRFLNWANEQGIDWRTIGLADMARFKIAVEQTPAPHGGQKSGKTVNATLTAVCGFLRFSAAHGHADSQMAVRLSEHTQRRGRQCIPPWLPSPRQNRQRSKTPHGSFAKYDPQRPSSLLTGSRSGPRSDVGEHQQRRTNRTPAKSPGTGQRR